MQELLIPVLTKYADDDIPGYQCIDTRHLQQAVFCLFEQQKNNGKHVYLVATRRMTRDQQLVGAPIVWSLTDVKEYKHARDRAEHDFYSRSEDDE
jgi:hypothetical protein